MSKTLVDTKLVFPDSKRTREVDEEKVEELMASIKAKGQKQPISVREIGPGAYKVNFGEHRLEACRRLGTKVWVEVEDVDDDEALVLKLTENSNRNEYIDPLKEGEYFADLMRKKFKTINDLAAATGKKEKYINDRLAVWYQLSPSLRKYVGKELTTTNAIAVARIPNHLDQIALTNRILEAKAELEGRGGTSGWGGGGYGAQRVSLRCTCPTCGKQHTKQKVPELIIETDPDRRRN